LKVGTGKRVEAMRVSQVWPRLNTTHSSFVFEITGAPPRSMPSSN
jgi:hypothetical protein